LVRSSPDNGHAATTSACRFRATSRHRAGFKRAVSVLLAAMWVGEFIGRYLLYPQSSNSECMVPCTYRDGFSVPDLGGHVMRLSSSFAAPSAVAILSIALLCGPSGTAMSQTATGSATSLPSITVEAPKQVARPQRTIRGANTVASRRTSPTAQTPSAAPGSVMARLAALERTSSNCTDGCQTSFKYGNQPWNGCSASSGNSPDFSPTCRNVRNYKTYFECKDTTQFLGWRNSDAWWYSSSLLAGGKLAGEKLQVAELKRSGRR